MAFAPPTVQHSTRPLQARFFRDRDIDALQASINDWLAEHPRSEIIEICQTPVVEAGETHLVISIWYIEG